MQLIQLLLARLSNDERGVTTAEYAVMLVLVAIAVATAAPNISQAITGVFQDLIDALTP
ncbi:MAG TPA: Flp family type IVb pilin [Acidobacteriota bacterium]|nr:Flp family type IVb pilin [Acidobacteriota bacterium]